MQTERQRIEIRDAVQGDVRVIQHIARLAWARAYDGIIPPEIQNQAIANWYAPDQLAIVLRAPGSTFLVAETSEAVVGFINLFIASAELVQLARIYILPSEQRKRIGTRLLNHAFAAVQPRAKTAIVDVEEQNRSARAFYERHGFAVVGSTMTSIFGFELPLIRYEKTIASGAAYVAPFGA